MIRRNSAADWVGANGLLITSLHAESPELEGLEALARLRWQIWRYLAWLLWRSDRNIPNNRICRLDRARASEAAYAVRLTP
jgi:hypothetical protein